MQRSWSWLAGCLVVGCARKAPPPLADAPAREAASWSSSSRVAQEISWANARLRLRYDPSLLTLRETPDGATLTSAPLGVIASRADGRPGRLASLSIAVHLRAQDLPAAMRALDPVTADSLFPGGSEAGFTAQPGFTDRVPFNAALGYRLSMGSHDDWHEVSGANLGDHVAVVVTCDFVGELARPRVPFAEQRRVCEQVIEGIEVAK